MSDGKKKALLTGDVKDFVAAMNPERQFKTKGRKSCKSVKNHHRTGR
ncbi:MAG: hypothetical protein ACYDBB_06280 [Armatimonadota bacterium]